MFFGSWLHPTWVKKWSPNFSTISNTTSAGFPNTTWVRLHAYIMVFRWSTAQYDLSRSTSTTRRLWRMTPFVLSKKKFSSLMNSAMRRKSFCSTRPTLQSTHLSLPDQLNAWVVKRSMTSWKPGSARWRVWWLASWPAKAEPKPPRTWTPCCGNLPNSCTTPDLSTLTTGHLSSNVARTPVGVLPTVCRFVVDCTAYCSTLSEATSRPSSPFWTSTLATTKSHSRLERRKKGFRVALSVTSSSLCFFRCLSSVWSCFRSRRCMCRTWIWTRRRRSTWPPSPATWVRLIFCLWCQRHRRAHAEVL